MCADSSDWHNPKMASVLGLHSLAFSQVWNESSLIWWNIAMIWWNIAMIFDMMKYCFLALTWRPKCPWVSLAHLLEVLILHWISVETESKNTLPTPCCILISAARPQLTLQNCLISSKTALHLVPPYLIISDSPIAFHFHYVNPWNPSGPNDQLVTWHQKHFSNLFLELSLACT